MEDNGLQLSKLSILQPTIMPHRALSEPFILHEIFLELPQQDLLLIQTVCRTWHELISTSGVLQAELYFQPDAENSPHRPMDDQVVLNPLLKSRFSSFFELHPTPPSAIRWALGPWHDTHWAKSARSQFLNSKSGSHLGFPAPAPVPYPRLDQQLSAAYRRRGASWRRMIPCRPAPTELQVSFDMIEFVTLYKMRFTSDRGTTCDGDSTVVAGDSRNNSILTFGLIYDIIEAACFQSIPFPADSMSPDYTFRDTPPPIPKPPRRADGLPRRFLTPEYILASGRFRYRKRLQEELPNEKIGGPGKVLLLLRGNMHTAKLSQPSPYKGQFTVQDSFNMEEFSWVDKIEHTRT